MKRALLASLVLTLLSALFIGCGGESTSSNNYTPTPTPQPPPTPLTLDANTFAFVRTAGAGSSAAISRQQFLSRMLYGQRTVNRNPGTGRAWTADIDAGTDSVVLMRNDASTAELVIASQAGWFNGGVQLIGDMARGVFSAMSGGHDQVFYVGLANLSNPVFTQLTFDAEDHFWPQLTRYGTAVVFVKWIGSDSLAQAAMVSTGGGTENLISTPTMYVSSPSFTPDSRIIFTDSYTAQIMMMNTDGSGIQTVAVPPDGMWYGTPSVSDDGLTVTFTCGYLHALGEADICSQNMDGSNLAQLTSDHLSADPMFVNNRIVFISWRYNSPNAEICSMKPDGTDVMRLTNDLVNEHF